MKKELFIRKLLFTLVILVVLLVTCGTALAAEIDITTDPAQITAAGSVNIKISITNDSQEQMSNISATGLGINNPPELYSQKLPAGGTLPVTVRNVGINADMLGKPQIYKFTWLEGTTQKSKEVAVTFGETQQSAAAMTATRAVSKDTGKEGDKITLTYTLKNPSTTSMTEVTVKDTIAGTNTIIAPFTLEPGISQNVTYEYTLGKENAVSQPTITYKVDGEQKSLTIDQVTIKLTNVSLQVTVTQNDPAPDGTLFTIALKNDGNQDISKISVKDELGVKVNEDVFTLKASEEKTLTFTVKTDTLRNVAFTITGTDALNQPYENKTKSLEARPYVDPSNIKFTMFVTVPEPLSESGRMKVRFAIQNDSSVEMTNATISEAELGVLESRTSLAQGETIVEKELRISEPRELQFTLSAADPSGTEHTYQAQVPAAYMPSTTPDPTQTASIMDPDEPLPEGGNDTLVTVLIVLAALMGVAGIALLVLSIYERKKGRAMPGYEAGDDRLPSAPVRGGRAKSRSKAAMEELASSSEPAQLPRAARNALPQRPPEQAQAAQRQQRPQEQAAQRQQRPQEQAAPRPQRTAMAEEKIEPQKRQRQPHEKGYKQEPVYEAPRKTFAQQARQDTQQQEPYAQRPARQPRQPQAYQEPSTRQEPYIPRNTPFIPQQPEAYGQEERYAAQDGFAPQEGIEQGMRYQEQPERVQYRPPEQNEPSRPLRQEPANYVNQQPERPAASTQQPLTGVRNRVHRVRPVDEDRE